MNQAKIQQTSRVNASTADCFEMLSKDLATDRSKTPLWVPKGESYGGDVLLLGFDTEYQSRDGRNLILSYQFYACAPTGENHWAGIYYPKRTRRMKLPQFVAHAVSQGLADGQIRQWPKQVYLIGHFTLADLSAFEDFENFKAAFDAIRRTFITIGREAQLTIWDLSRHCHKIKLTLRDSMLLAPGDKQSLKALGELTGAPKFELQDGEIEKMEHLLDTDPNRFEEYALRDPEIAVQYAIKIMNLNRELLGVEEIPPTLSSIGVGYLLKVWADAGVDKHAVLGTEVVEERDFVAAIGRTIKRRVTVPTPDRFARESFATECYHGGRNEQFFFGASQVGLWTDYDICGAYTTAMSMIGVPHWNLIRTTKDIQEFQPNALAYARIRFRFPANTRFPCLPVRTAGSLIFPLSGETFCCSPELYLARSMGAQIEIVDGIVLPTDFNNRPFEQFILECTKRRKSFPKKSLEELFWKELGNGTYGKTAQGLRRKRVFDSRSGSYQDLPESKITNPYFAAYVTSLVRAAVGEIMARLPLHVQVSNVTTDGFLSTATAEEVCAAAQGPICELFAAARLGICGDLTVVEAKHVVQQVLGWRTRGQATLLPAPGQEIVLAKAGLKAPTKDKGEQNDWIIKQFMKRDSNTTQTLKLLRTLPDIHKNGGDLVSRELIRRVSMEFDWKRAPANVSTRPIGDMPHLFFDTVPWQSVTEYNCCRDDWERFTNHQGGLLKTESDLNDFVEYRRSPAVSGTKKSRRSTAVSFARRMFLRAYTRSVWGLDATAMSYVELAAWLSSLGYSTKKADVENAKRPSAKLIENVVARTPAVLNFVEKIREKFPAFAPEKLLLAPTSFASASAPLTTNLKS